MKFSIYDIVHTFLVQMKRTPSAFPTVSFDEGIKDIEGFTSTNIHLHYYKPQGAIKMQMAI